MTRWQDNAECGTANGSLFGELTKAEITESRGHPTDIQRVRAALAYCADCPVWKQCAVDGASNPNVPVPGVYGRQYVDRITARHRQQRAKVQEARRHPETARIGRSQVRNGVTMTGDMIAVRNAQMAEQHNAGWSLRTLAERYGISHSRVSRIVNGIG